MVWLTVYLEQLLNTYCCNWNRCSTATILLNVKCISTYCTENCFGYKNLSCLRTLHIVAMTLRNHEIIKSSRKSSESCWLCKKCTVMSLNFNFWKWILGHSSALRLDQFWKWIVKFKRASIVSCLVLNYCEFNKHGVSGTCLLERKMYNLKQCHYVVNLISIKRNN